MSKPSEHREIEFKFRVPSSADIDLNDLLHQWDENVTRLPTRSMEATYFDTPNLSLIRWGITMRHRVGGGDDGWHLKLPSKASDGSTARDELHVDAPAGQIPVAFASITAPLVRRQEFQAAAVVRTERKPFEISDGKDQLVEIVDDLVAVSTAQDPTETHTFREIEVELIHDTSAARTLAAELSTKLLATGAEASSVSKAAQALGPGVADPPDVPELAYPSAEAPAIDALQAIFARYVRDLLTADVGIRRDLPDSVHQMRVACRRLRSTLRTFDSVLDPDSVAFLRGELTWLASELGEVRDMEVQRSRLACLTDDEELQAFITEAIDARLRAAQSGVMAALRSDRHDFLLEDLILLVMEPPVQGSAFEPAGAVARTALTRPWNRLRKTVGRAESTHAAEDWHRVRLRAKQTRYAAEAIAPVLGPHVQQLGRLLGKATDILGQRQDAQVAHETLMQLASAASGNIAFRLGVLAARNEAAGLEDVRAFQRLWSDIVTAARKAGLD